MHCTADAAPQLLLHDEPFKEKKRSLEPSNSDTLGVDGTHPRSGAGSSFLLCTRTFHTKQEEAVSQYYRHFQVRELNSKNGATSGTKTGMQTLPTGKPGISSPTNHLLPRPRHSSSLTKEKENSVFLWYREPDHYYNTPSVQTDTERGSPALSAVTANCQVRCGWYHSIGNNNERC